MFEKICITNKRTPDKHIDIEFLIDKMLFYKDINIILYNNDLIELIRLFGEDILAELIKSNRIKLYVETNHFQPSLMYDLSRNEGIPSHSFSILFNENTQSMDSYLYSIHRELDRNSTNNMKFADKFSSLISFFRYEDILFDHIINDMTNVDYLRKATPLLVNGLIPPENFVFQLTKREVLEKTVYSIETNILEYMVPKKEKREKINLAAVYGPLIFSLPEARTLNYLGSSFNCEIATDNQFCSQLIEWQLLGEVKKYINSDDQIQLFNKHVLPDFPSLGQAFVNKQIDKKQLLSVLDKSDRFKEWLHKMPEGTTLLTEYIQEISRETLADRKITQFTRFIITQTLGIIPIPGLGLIVDGIDTFYMDKILKGWKPNMFINDVLRKGLKNT